MDRGPIDNKYWEKKFVSKLGFEPQISSFTHLRLNYKPLIGLQYLYCYELKFKFQVRKTHSEIWNYMQLISIVYSFSHNENNYDSCNKWKVREVLDQFLLNLTYSVFFTNGPGNSNGKALGYGLHGPGPDHGSWRGADFSSSLRVRTGPGVHSVSYKMSIGGKAGRV